eukprot:CAMPEP_0172754236 /NCGR_PEP_ID=MMETSP1074-20121228/157518_1 /TAXON_ID=2916 /ORGANISM="Ceratium fusus, Strain PA161109" /LENGTH=49 /DNA_ID= /DNA_START= /DNA_END= /DNA_ORIENTATION=
MASHACYFTLKQLQVQAELMGAATYATIALSLESLGGKKKPLHPAHSTT